MTDTTASVPQLQTPDDTKVTVERRISQFIDLRDKIKEIQERHEAELKPLLEVKDMVAGWLQTFMENAGCDKVGTDAGTCHFTTRTSASVADPALFMSFVIENKQFDLLDRRANVTAVKSYAKENKTLPPGVNLSTIKTVGVRRPGKSTDD